MKTKSNKLKNLEAKRKSILTDDLKHCYICRQKPVDMHEIYGGCNRLVSIKNDFCVPLCRRHHFLATYNIVKNLELKVICQKEFEKTHTRDEFLKLIGRNYLEEV